MDMFDAWHEFCDVAIVRDQLKDNLKFWDEMDTRGLTTIDVINFSFRTTLLNFYNLGNS